MYYEFNLDNYDRFFEYLTTFAGNDNSAESYRRNMFVENMGRIFAELSDAEVDDDMVMKLNKIIENILNYKILITDIYEIVGNKYYRLEDFIDKFYDFSSVYDKSLSKIYTMKFKLPTGDVTTADDISSVGDVFVYNVDKMVVKDTNVYIKPIIKYSYLDKSTNNFFVNSLSALSGFYVEGENTPIHDAIFQKLNLTNNELITMYEHIKASYLDKNCFLYILGNEKENEDFLTFFKNLKLNITDNQVTDTLQQIYNNNAFMFDVPSTINLFNSELYKRYYSDKLNYYLRNIVFDPEVYVDYIYPTECKNITIKTFAYNLMLSIIKSKDKSNVVEIERYLDELKDFKSYLMNIYNVCVNTGKYTIEGG